MRFVIDFVYLLAVIGVSPVLVYRVIRHKRYRSGWAQRFGRIARKYPEKKCIWLHAVSVGEVNATKTIVEELEKRFGDFEIVISSTTDTGFARANTLFAAKHTIVYFPFDFSWIMRRAFRNICPAICLLMELEVWPNLVQIAQRSGIPVMIINGRITEKSFAGYRRIRPVAKKIFQNINLILAQTDEYAERFREIGAAPERVIVTGSLKYDTAQIADRIEGADMLAAKLNIGDERLWIAGGTGNDEEKILLDVYRNLRQQDEFSDLRLVIVPRKPERFDEVAELIANAGFDFVRYSSVKSTDTSPSDKVPVILGDTMGDLRKFYSLATVIFVGRSLVPMGGSDMMEAAALGKCTVFGPHASNFRQTVDALLHGRGAIMVKDQQDLVETMRLCLTKPGFATEIAANGREVIRKNQGATQKTIDQIERFLKTA
jgi:3-deoxy-D-manno-octulosonic-acid transferase